MTNWQADLEAKIDSLTDGDWENCVMVIPGGGMTMTRSVRVDVSADWQTTVNLGFVVGFVNAQDFCKVPPRQLLLDGVEAMGEESDGLLRFVAYRAELVGRPAVDFAAKAEGRD